MESQAIEMLQLGARIVGPLFSLPTIVSLLCVLTVVYYKHKFSYWTKRGLRTPTPIPWFGTSHYPLLTAKPELELSHHRNYGKIYGLYDGFMGVSPTLVCGHPEAIKQVTIKHFDNFTNRRKPATWKSIRFRALTYMRDDEWRNMRKILAPTFTSNKIKRMYELMKRCTNNLSNSIASNNKFEIDLKKVFSVYTVDVISTCCFSMDLKDYRHPDSEVLLNARKFFEVSRFKMGYYMAIPKTLLAMFGFDINDTSAINFFERFATEIINKRRELAKPGAAAAYKKKDDFLQILIDAAAEFSERANANTTNNNNNDSSSNNNNDSSSNNNNNNNKVANDAEQDIKSTRDSNANEPVQRQLQQQPSRDLNQNHDQAMTTTTTTTTTTTMTMTPATNNSSGQYTEQQLGDLEILAQSMLFFAVGHETTATLLSSCGLFLSLYPDLQQRLYDEIHQAFAEGNGDISYERIMELQYLDAFISEALRYFTPTLNFDREAKDDVEIEVDGQKILISKGMGVIIPFHAIHHDPDNYEDPERFDPERFMPENRHKIKPCTFIPFGSGPRYCLASRFALVEAKLALASLVNRFKFVRSEGTIWPPKYRHHYMLLQMQWPKIRFIDRKLDGLEQARPMESGIAA